MAPTRPPLFVYRAVIAVAALLLLCLRPAIAHAWVESHHVGDDVHVVLDAQGRAVVEHALRYVVQMGPIKSFEVQGIDPSAVLEPSVAIEGSEIAARVEPLPERPDEATEGKSVRLVVDSRRGLSRGKYTLFLRYTLDGARLLERDASRLRFTFRGLRAPEGYDSARLILTVPKAATPPALASVEWGQLESQLRRGPDEDELELLRPHVARGEAPVYAVAIDPKALSLQSPVLAAPEVVPGVESPWVNVGWVAVGALSALFGYFVVAEQHRRHRASGARRRAVLPVPQPALLVAATLAGSVLLEALQQRTMALALVLMPLLVVAERPIPASLPSGAWQPATRLEKAWLGGLLRFVLVLVLACMGVLVAWAASGIALATTTAARMLALLPAIVGSLPASDLWPLRRVARHLDREEGVLASLIAPPGEAKEHVRVHAQVAEPLDGFSGLELGLTRAGFSSQLRLREGSSAEARALSRWPSAYRRMGADGYTRLSPEPFVPGLRAVVARAMALLATFTERRAVITPVVVERRRPTDQELSPAALAEDTEPLAPAAQDGGSWLG